MNQIKWDEYFSVNVKAMDNQHIKFIDMLNACLQAKEAKALDDITFDTLKDMMNYLSKHFKDEEELMRAHGYPDLEAHIKLHKDFVLKTTEFLDRYVNERGAIGEDILDYLKDWFLNHIIKVDKQYSDFLNAKGIN